MSNNIVPVATILLSGTVTLQQIIDLIAAGATSVPTTLSANLNIPAGSQVNAAHRLIVPAGLKIILGTNSVLVRG